MKAKQLRHRSASPALPRVAGFVLVLAGCSNRIYNHQIRQGNTFLQRLWTLVFTHAVRGPASSQH